MLFFFFFLLIYEIPLHLDMTLGIDCISLGLSVKVKMTRKLVGGFQ